MRARTVLISGASIAGPALAYWLSRYGFEVTVVEVAPELRDGGQAVDLRGAGKEALTRMGLMPTVRAARVDERGMAYVDSAGRYTARMPVDAFGGEGFVAEIEIMRGDLTRILHEATREGVEYLFGDRIERLSQDDGGVAVSLRSGVTRVFDLVVGADGVHSGVRRLAFGPDVDFVRPLGAYTAYFAVPDPGDLGHWFEMYSAPGGRVAGVRPDGAGSAKAMLTFASAPLAYDRRDTDRQRQILTEVFAGVGWRVPWMLAAMAGAGDFYFDSIDQVAVDRWSRGRITLIGDALSCGSPITGLGTSMAMVQAYVLAGELASSPDDHATALARYQDVLTDYVTRARELPPGGVSGMLPRTRFMISLRNLSMRMMHRWPMRGMLAKQFGKAERFTLPDYAPVAQPAG